MRKLIMSLSLLICGYGFAVGTIVSEDGVYELDRMGPIARKYGLGTALKSAQTFGAKGTYTVSLDGGAVASYNLNGLDSENLVLPAGAIITDCFYDVVQAMSSSGGSGEIAVTAASSGDLVASVDADSVSGRVACIPEGTEANMIKLTSAKTLLVEVGSEALTAGKINVFVEYVLSDVN